jgi:alpha-tubulin suppressor-like RCC1 family protein
MAGADLVRLVRWAFRALGVVVITLVLATCTDNPVGPGKGGVAYLRLQPVFDVYSRVAPLTLDRVRIRVIRPPTSVLADVSQPFSPTATTVQLSVPVRLERTSEDLEIHLEMYAGTILLFSGMDSARVTAGQSSAVSQIPVSYQGPGANIASISLGPRDTLVPAGATFAFTADAVDAQQAPVTQFYLSWSVTGGRIDGAGQFTAPAAADTVWVRGVTPTGIWDSTQVFVTGLPTQLTIAGGDGQTGLTGTRLAQPLAVLVSDGSSMPVPGATVSFSVLTGGGSVDSTTATTDAQGIARSGAVLGPTAGTQTFGASTGNLTPVTFTATATTLPAPGSVLISAGDQFTCDIRAGGAAYCCGLNSSGQLGDGTTTNRRAPIPVAGGLTFTSISAGFGHACGVATGGTVYCWGSNTNGQLGDGTTTPHLTPAPVSGSYSAVHAGAGFTCALGTGGQAFCWGQNGRGNLGDGTTTQRLVPTAVSGGLTFAQLSLFADNHACGLASSGDVYCWGYNFDGAVGDGTTTDRSVPTLVLGGRTYQAVASGHFHSCALDAGGAAWCWGDNNVGQIGDGGAPTDRLFPVQVQGGQVFTTLKAGGGHSCGLTSGGQAFCWGFNPNGQLGNGTTTSSQTPVQVSSAGFTALSTGSSHTCGLAGSGAQCWGDNAAGQLGDGFTVSQPVPVPVQNPPATVTIQAGNNQVAAPGTAVAIPPAVLVRDALNNPLTGVEVIFAVTGGGGSIPGSTAITASNGIASVASWTLGTTPGTNTLTATVSAGGVAGNPVTFTANATSPLTTRTWTGATSFDWSVAGNWSPAQVPTTADDVIIPAGTANAPGVTASCSARTLTVNPGATLSLNGVTCQVLGDVFADGQILGPGVMSIAGAGQVRGSMPSLTVNNAPVAVSAGANLTTTSNVTVTGNAANFDVSDGVVQVGGSFTTQSGGLIRMTNPAGLLRVLGSFTAGGGSLTGQLTAGTIQISGNFAQLATTSATSFVATGSHVTAFTGAGTHTVNFASPGVAASRFNDLDLTGSSGFSGGVTLGTPAWATRLVAGAPNGPPVLNGTASTVLTADGAAVSGLTVNGAPIVLGDGPISQFDNASFAGFATTVTPLTVANRGAAALTFNSLSFSTVPTSAFYLSANDIDTATSGVLTINMVNPTPPTADGPVGAGQYKQEINGAVINWPAVSPGLTWNGSFNADWNVAANWTPNGIPNGSTDVIIPAGTPNQPTLSANAFAANLTLQSGGTQLGLGAQTLQVGGNLVVDGSVTSLTGGKIVMVNTNKLLSGAGLLQADLDIQATTLLGNNFSMQGSLTTSSVFSLNGHSMSVVGNFSTTTATGLLYMLNPSDVLVVTLNATFDGGDELATCPGQGGCLSEGVLAIGGNLTQLASNSPDSYHPSGNHLTGFTGANPTISFATPGIVPGSSHFEALEWSGVGTMTLASDAYAHGSLFISSGAATTIAGADRLLQIGGYTGTLGLTLDGVRLAVDDSFGTGSLALHDITFQNMNADLTQLSVVHPGTGGPFTFTNLAFSTPPTPGVGFYVSAIDAASTDGIPLVIDMVSPSPATTTAIQALPVGPGGAVINWPATGAVYTWTGAADNNWSNPGNWDRNAVPGVIDDAVLVPITNQPTMSGSTGINNLTLQAGAILDVDTTVLVVGGSLDNAGTITGLAGTGGIVLAGTGKTMRGTVAVDVVIPGSYTLNGGFTGLNVSVAGAAGSLDLAGNTLSITADFSTVNSGTLTMIDPNGLLDVGGSAFFMGGDETGKLTAGTLQVAGDFSQIGITAPTSFVADIGFNVNLTGTNPLVSLTDPASSRFFGLSWGAIGGTLSLGSDVTALGGFTAPDGAATMLGNGHTLTVGTLFTQFLTVDDLPIVIDQPVGGFFTDLFGLTFTNMATTATQLTIRNPGNPGGGNTIFLDQVAFDSLSTGATGLYLSVEDTDLNDAVQLFVSLTGATPNDPTNQGADKFYLKVTGTEAIDWNGQTLP